ncbi:protein kinase domain-containing protein [Streptomyces sp. SLBN-8D4]|uniref:serine/threonine-protein kinase n=1 Tax=Streptomyces sp. SLBN-8D4 TaxID=3377728 RepID=UPI003C7A45A1
MGRVWRAADEMLDRQVAVKEMRIDGLDAEDTRTRRERTLREARATARIDHPNVVRVYDVVDEGERLWIVMELVKGRSLERMTVEDGPLGPRDTALLGLGLVRALRQVHARGVLHRDIKPGNVLVESGDRTGRRIVLTDFGIAAMQDAKALTMVGMLVGSPDYMAPERVSGRPQGPPSDIWSLGATLCAALGGRSPFSRDTTLATLHAVLYEEPELPAAAGPLTDILTALLEKDPSIRPSLDEAESALHTVAFPAPTPTLRMEAGEDVRAAGQGEQGEPDGDAGGAGDEREVEERGAGPGAGTWTDPGREASAGGQGDSARVSESGQADGARQPEAAPESTSQRAGTSAPAWVQGELRDPRDPRGPEAPDTAGASGTPGGSGGAGGPSAPDGPGTPDSPGAPSDVREDAPDVPVSPDATTPPEASGTPPGLPSGSTDTSDAGPGSSEPPPVRWTKQEPPTPADLDTRVVRAVRDPRVPEPETEAATGEPAEVEDAVPGLSGAGSARAESRSVAEGAEPADAVPLGRGSSGAGVGGRSGSVPARSGLVAEGAEPADAVPLGRGSSGAGVGGRSGSGPARSGLVAEGAEPADAVPLGRGSSGAGVGGRSGSGPARSGLVAEGAEPADAVPLGHVCSEVGVARDSGSSSDGARSVAQRTEPSDAVASDHTASDVAGTGGPTPDAVGVEGSAPDGRGAGGSAPDGTGAADSAPDAANAVGEAVAARSELGVPDEPFTPPRLPEPSADHRASASTEAVSEERSEVRSETPPGNSGGAVLRAGATTTSTPLASAPTQDSLAAGVPTEHFPMPDAPTRDTPSRAASAPTRVGPVPPTHRRPHHPGPARPAPTSGSRGTADPGSGSDVPTADPRTDPGTPVQPHPGRDLDPDPALILGPHPHRIPPGELLGPRRGRRRTALVAAGSMVAAGAVVVAIILATTSGSPGDDKAGSSTSASASASSSAPGASTPGGTPSSTVEGTARPRSLPPGAHEEAGGFAWKTPTGWRRDVKTGAEVHYTSPDGQQELAAKSSLARGDLMETWRTSEQNAHQGQDYRKIRLEETRFRDHPAVVWEYTFTLGGVPWHAHLLGFNVGDKSYQINTWYQPDIETQALNTYEKVKESFTVL